MKVLLAASEVAPIIKIGGLGDVVGSLPKALEKLGVDADVIVPFFSYAKVAKLPIYKSLDLLVPFAGNSHKVGVYKTQLPNSTVDVFLLKCDTYFGESEMETEKFAFFSRAVVDFIKSAFNTYDLIHCNDWHTGLITHILEDELRLERPATLFTIHNLLYQGSAEGVLLKDMGLDSGDHRFLDWDLADGDVNFMLQGAGSSDYINTVSETYAKEILAGEFGGGVSDVLQSRRDRFTGILNGIEPEVFPRKYELHNWQEGKRAAKAELLTKLKLPVSDEPLFAFISRLDPNQKGLDILIKVIPEIVRKGGTFVLLGTGDVSWEKKLKELEHAMPKNVSVNIGFDSTLANLIYSGSDFFIVPSKYEPCGLTQMVAMHYGTLPIVHKVGGLADTVVNMINGFSFEKYTSGDLLRSVIKAIDSYGKNLHSIMVRNAFKTDFSWDKSALEYKKLYNKVVEMRKGN